MRGPVIVSAVCLSAASTLGATPEGDGIVFDDDRSYAGVRLEQPWPPAAFTVAAWVRLNHTEGSQIFVNQGMPPTAFTLYLYNDRIRMLVETAPGSYTHANAAPPNAGVWTHYAGTYDGQSIVLYVNGREAARTEAAGRMPARRDMITLGALPSMDRRLHGALDEVQLWDRALSPEAVEGLVARGPNDAGLATDRWGLWLSMGIDANGIANRADAALPARFRTNAQPKGHPDTGYRGIWYANQPLNNEYKFKYSGGLGTYCAKHIPLAIYDARTERTFFCYGGTAPDANRLWHMVSYFDHKTGQVPRPTFLLDKYTDDAHDNPVMQIDRDGYIWVFSSSHGTARPSYLHRSAEPGDIRRFEHVRTTNFSYTQPWYLARHGFVFLHTVYRGGRALHVSTSPDGTEWTDPALLSLIDQGHYQVSWPWRDKVGTAFNYHPKGKGLNWRTNLYYMETRDGGASWTTVSGTALDMPLSTPGNPALVHDYAAEGLNVYMKDLNYDAAGNPIILYITSRGYESGPRNDPRTWCTARWTGEDWEIHGQITSDNNYDTGCLHVEADGTWRIIGPTETGPQPYNPGGEVALWSSPDQGRTWTMLKQLTRNSERNHTYCRRPLNAHPDFYAFWADGHGRRKSDSSLYFTDRDGTHVWRLPRDMPAETAKPETAW